MCSIAGSPSLNRVISMLDIQGHRAPDGLAYDQMGDYHLGMGRLAIIDLESDGLCLYREEHLELSFNGEIYNYIELRAELRGKGWDFTTDSDQEVLVKAYRQWGLKMFDKLNGMFAFAIYDTKKQKILLARDIAGEKPLYFKRSPFEFSSEAKALNFKCEEFPPAHYAFYDVKKKTLSEPRPYWKLKPIEISNDPVDELDHLLADSVKLRTRSDVPYALYYSKGVDSSLISTYHDFKYKFEYKDGDYKKEFKKVFPKILWHLDYPVEHFSPFALWKLAEMASKKVKVVLSGEGADELFGGYVRYVLPHFEWQAKEEFPSYKNMFGGENVTAAGWREFNGNLRVLLRMGDRMSSAFGLENRCIFLDRRIIEFAFSLPYKYKIDGIKTKVILNEILKRRDPGYKEIEKKGLLCSVNSWLGVSKEGYGKETYMLYQKKLWKEFRSKK